MIRYIRKLVYRHLKQTSGQAVILLLGIYVALSWLLLNWSQEEALLGSDFFYWLMVTASTVGYGDLSPSTANGKIITSLFIIPVGLSLFALVIGKVAAFGAYQWRKGIMGAKTLDLENHILVIGWDGPRTLSLLNLLKLEADQNLKRTICLYTTQEMENPLPGEIEFIRGPSFNDDQTMVRACADTASIMIIDTASDDSTLAAALYATSLNSQAHVIAYFRNDALSKLLKQHCPKVECAPSVSTELLVKAAMDPGSSALHQELVNAGRGMTQYSVTYPVDHPTIRVGEIYSSLKQQYGATLLAVADNTYTAPSLNPDLELPVNPGSVIYYIADQRIHNFDWANLILASE